MKVALFLELLQQRNMLINRQINFLEFEIKKMYFLDYNTCTHQWFSLFQGCKKHCQGWTGWCQWEQESNALQSGVHYWNVHSISSCNTVSNIAMVLYPQGSFQLEFVSISRVINHMTCYKFKCSHWLKLQHSDWRANLVKHFFLNKISTNERTWIYNRSHGL